jgi:xanthine dehydrogenase/oxidase
MYPISKVIPKLEAKIQTSGESVYTDDSHHIVGMLYAACVTSTHANAAIESIDASEALQMPGVKAFFCAKDLKPENNTTEPSLPDEEVFASTRVSYYGQNIGIIVADSQIHADNSAQKVKVSYTDIQPPILTVEDAIAKNSFFKEEEGPVTTGDLQKGFDESQHIIEGKVSNGSQAHFYLESQTCFCIPEEGGTFKIIASTQWPKMIQESVARTVGLQSSQVTVEVRRLGGGFGGKVSRNVIPYCAAAFASSVLGAPVRMVMNIKTNMEMIGKRHPFTCKYKVGFSDEGRMKALEMHLFCNKGAALDWGGAPITIAFQNIDNCYKVDNFYVDAKTCKTNLPPNTSTRAPGWVQAIFFMEHIVEHIATYLNITPDVVKRSNFYQSGDITPTKQHLVAFTIPKLWEDIQISADYQNRLATVQEHNRNNRWTKRGMSLVPVKFGVLWSHGWFGTLVNIYSDGTIAISTGGIEMGQGLNTKVTQAAAMALGVPMDLITVHVASTLTQPNVTATQGSIGSELSVKATLEACKILKQRLEPIRNRIDNPTWKRVIQEAYNSGVYLQASSWTNPPPSPNGHSQYNTHGVACVEVEVDVLTGEIQIIRADIHFDCGISMNPAIDIGQIEGGFVMGLGMHLTEEIIYNPDGVLLTSSTWEYKPPLSKDIPIEFNVRLLKNATNENCVLSAKAVGEPPITMSCAGLFAVQHAIAEARCEIKKSGYFELDSPATVDKIQRTCEVDVSQFTLV